MGAAKDMWMDEIEQVCTDYAFEAITKERALDRLSQLGIDPDEAETMLQEAVS